MATATQIVTTDPLNLAQVRTQTDWPEWDQSIRHELQQLEWMGAWELVDLPKDANVVGSHFVFHYKLNVAGKIASSKVRLIAQGFSQQEGVNYNQTFSPTAKLSTICIIATLAACNDWELEQTDVDGAYLNAPLTVTIYMRQPKGYEVPGKEHKVCQLVHALYRLKQAGREWYLLLYDVMWELGFTHCQTEHAVFYRYADEDALIVAVDINDLTMAGNMQHAIATFKLQLSRRFKIKDHGDLHWLLGIEVK